MKTAPLRKVEGDGSNFVTIIITDIMNFIANPTTGNLIKIGGDISMYYVIPLLGGYLRAEAKRQYLSDVDTYQVANIKELDLYEQSMSLMKTKFWALYGKL